MPATVPVRPIDRTARGDAPAIGNHHKGGQVIRFAPQSIGQPGPHDRKSIEPKAGRFLKRRGAMVRGFREHGIDDRQLVGHLSEMRKEIRNLQSALAVLVEPERTLHEMADRPAVGADGRRAGVGLAVEARQRRLGVEGIDVTGRAVHEEEDGMLRASLARGRSGGAGEAAIARE